MTHEQPPKHPAGDEPPTSDRPPVTPAGQAAPEADNCQADSPPPDAEQHEQHGDDQPRIWAGSLSDYNNGVLHGAWIDAARDPKDVQTDITSMLAASPWTARTGEPAEEWGVFDTDNFGACRIGQHEDLDWISAVARGIAEHGPAFAAWADVMEDRDRLPDFEEAYLGEYDSLEAYVDHMVQDLGYDELLDRAVPPNLRPYVEIDIAGLAQDMWLNSEVQVYQRSGGGVWIFDAK